MSLKNYLLTSAAILCTFTTLMPVSVLAQRRHPAEEIGIRSVNGNLSTNIKFVNNRQETVKVQWLDYRGKRKFYKTLSPNEQYDQQTYLTHPWLITDTNNNSLYLFFPDAQPRTIEIQ
jgi:von Hippel-Lindau disease tumor supressor